MSERRARSVGVISMLLLVLLAVVGIVFGLGAGGLSVDRGVAQTTDLDVDWECAWANDDGQTTDCGGLGDEPDGDDGLDPNNHDWPNFNSWDHPRKDVGECLATLAPPVGSPEGEQLATVTIGNAYPSYECTFTFVIRNAGSIPFFIGSLNTAVGSPLELLDDTCTTIIPDGGDTGILAEGASATIQCTIHVMQEAEQNHLYSFTISACGDPCDGSLLRAFWQLGRGRGAPASLGLSITSHVD